MHGVSVTMFDTDEDKGKAYVMQTAHIGFSPQPDLILLKIDPESQRKERTRDLQKNS